MKTLVVLSVCLVDRFTDPEGSLTHSDDLLPFSKTPNPVMALLAFLADVIDTSVAAEGAKAALSK